MMMAFLLLAVVEENLKPYLQPGLYYETQINNVTWDFGDHNIMYILVVF